MINLDPRTMPWPELRDVVRQTHYGLRGAWVRQALAFRRIREEELYRESGFETWTDYVQSDLPGLDPRNVKKMMQAIRYLERTEAGVVSLIAEGGPGAPPVSGWPAMVDLATLYNKAEATDWVEESDWRALHDRAIDGTLTDNEIRRRCTELGRGLVHLRDDEKGRMTPEQQKFHTATNAFAMAAHNVKVIGRMAKAGKISPSGHHGCVSRLRLLMQAMDEALGAEYVDRLLAETRRPKKPATPKPKALGD